jgi:lipopolysaccharide export system protein LptA
MKGDRPFSLTTDPSGELLYNFNDDNELESVTAKKGVVFTSEDMTLNADQLDYKAETSALVATGRKVIVRQGEMIATCQLFRYFPDTQKSELSGSPVVYNKSKDGKVNTTSGEKITIDVVNGKPIIKVHGGNSRPSLQQGGGVAPSLNMGNSQNARVSASGAPEPSAGGMMSGSSTAPAPTEQATTQPGGQGALPQMSIPIGGMAEKKPGGTPKTNQIDPANAATVESYSDKRK